MSKIFLYKLCSTFWFLSKKNILCPRQHGAQPSASGLSAIHLKIAACHLNRASTKKRMVRGSPANHSWCSITHAAHLKWRALFPSHSARQGRHVETKIRPIVAHPATLRGCHQSTQRGVGRVRYWPRCGTRIRNEVVALSTLSYMRRWLGYKQIFRSFKKN